MVQERSRYCKARPFCRTAAKAMACKKARTNYPQRGATNQLQSQVICAEKNGTFKHSIFDIYDNVNNCQYPGNVSLNRLGWDFHA